MEEREGIKLGYIYFDGGGVESNWTVPVLGIHTGCTGDSPDKDFMDLYTPSEVVRYYPNAASGLGKFFTVDWANFNPNILEMHPDKDEIFNVKKVDLFGVCKMMNNVDVIDEKIDDKDTDPINELKMCEEADYHELSKQLNDRNLIIEILLKELRQREEK